jgi:hypothetical protein
VVEAAFSSNLKHKTEAHHNDGNQGCGKRTERSRPAVSNWAYDLDNALQSHLAAPLPHPHLQIAHRRPDVPLSPLRDHPGSGDGDRPPPREEGRENLVFRGLEADRLEAGLGAFGQAADVAVRGAATATSKLF